MIDAAEHIPLAHSIVNQLCVYDFINRYEKEDLLQIAYTQLTIAANRFDESRGYKFSTYAFPFIKNGLLRHANRDKAYNIRRNEPHHYKVYSLDLVFDNNGDKPTPAEDILNTGNEFEDELINNIDLKSAIGSLTEIEKEVIKLYYFQDITQKDIGKLLNTSQVQISRILEKSLSKMKKYLEGGEKDKSKVITTPKRSFRFN